MPIVTEDVQAAAALLDRIRKNRPPRTPGTHMSDLVYCLRKSVHRRLFPDLWAPGGVYQETDKDTMFFLLGKGHHQVLESRPEQTYQIPGLAFTPDELDFEVLGLGPQAVVNEFKTTRKSAKQTPTIITGKSPDDFEGFDTYTDQLWFYCSKLGITTGLLYALHLVGYYSPPTPVLRAWRYEFSPEELNVGSAEVERRRLIYEYAVHIGQVPIEEHYTWECSYCPLHRVVCPGGPGRAPMFPTLQATELTSKPPSTWVKKPRK